MEIYAVLRVDFPDSVVALGSLLVVRGKLRPTNIYVPLSVCFLGAGGVRRGLPFVHTSVENEVNI